LAERDVADIRAWRIASVAAEELVRSEGEHTDSADEFLVPACQVDEHMRDSHCAPYVDRQRSDSRA
jgi:hypothetical protein